MCRKSRKQIKTLPEFLSAFEQFCKGHGLQPPYFRVSDPIHNDAELEAAFRGERLAYARLPGHPDHVRLEKWLADFEDGAVCRVRSDGMGAVTAAVIGAALARHRSHFVFILPLYGGTIDFAEVLRLGECFNFEFTFLYSGDPDLLRKLYYAIHENTAAVLFETEGNPTLPLAEVEGIVYICTTHPRAHPIIIGDDTFLFGIFKPLHWGVDVVIGSGTKYLVNESVWPLGYMVLSKDFLEKEEKKEQSSNFWHRANQWAGFGGTLGIFESWATGIFSPNNILERIQQHSKNGAEVAHFLEEHYCVEHVIHPALSSYPWPERVCKYLEPVNGQQCCGGMILFYVKGDLDDAKRFLYHLTKHSHIEFKASLAGPDDMIESPVLLSHKSMHPLDKARCGITDNGVRLSVGRVRPAEETIAALDYSLRKTIKAK